MLFGHVKKEAVLNTVRCELNLNYQLYQKYNEMVKDLRKHEPEDSIAIKQYAEFSDSFFARYVMCKELMTRLEKL